MSNEMSRSDALKLQRIVGILMVLAGTGLAYIDVYQPLNNAARHIPNLTVSMKLIAATPLLLVGGIVFLLFPRFALDHVGGYQSGTPKTAFGWAFVVGVILLGFGFWFLIQAYLRSQGYSV